MQAGISHVLRGVAQLGLWKGSLTLAGLILVIASLFLTIRAGQRLLSAARARFQSPIRKSRAASVLVPAAVVLMAATIWDQGVARLFIPDNFAHRNLDDVRSHMMGVSVWRPLAGYRPALKRDGEFVIGIFGGSVADQFAASPGLLEVPAAVEY